MAKGRRYTPSGLLAWVPSVTSYPLAPRSPSLPWGPVRVAFLGRWPASGAAAVAAVPFRAASGGRLQRPRSRNTRRSGGGRHRRAHKARPCARTAARLPTKESRVKWRGGNPPTNDCCTQRTASAQAAVRAKVLPNLIEPRAVRAAVKTASRLTVGLAASLDRRCARRSIDFAGRDGETGAQAEQRNLTLATRGFGRFQ